MRNHMRRLNIIVAIDFSSFVLLRGHSMQHYQVHEAILALLLDIKDCVTLIRRRYY